MANSVEIFEGLLQNALDRVKVILDATKAPCFASNTNHRYQDKYLLAECLTNTAAASHVNCLAALGLQQESLRQACQWAASSAVSLQFRSRETCVFKAKQETEVESPTKQVTEVSMADRLSSVFTNKTVTKVTEWTWDFEASYKLELVRGVGEAPGDRLPVLSRTGRVQRATSTEAPPAVQAREAASHDINISWLLKQLDPETLMPLFKVSRDSPKCCTPVRNPEMDGARAFFADLGRWAHSVQSYGWELLKVVDPETLKRGGGDPKVYFGPLSAVNVFIPVLPLFADAEVEEPRAAAAISFEQVDQPLAAAADPPLVQQGLVASLPATGAPEGALLALADTNRLLGEEARSLQQVREQAAECFSSDSTVATSAEAMLTVTLKHISNVSNQWAPAVGYIEDMLRSQLVAAIGKELRPADFAEYMGFHNRKLFNKAYVPIPFCFPVRRSAQHSPEGTVSLEERVVGGGGDSNIEAPIVTFVQRAQEPHHMKFALGASTSVTFRGERFLHAYLSHQFSGQSGASLSLVARARQFSSMLVLVGRITGVDTFDPQYAAIVQNKDELTIPLQLSTIPSATEFRDAIESLSPEQQAFAKAFRGMQLESTLFGMLIINIKPQLEAVLNLPKDSLTKEIKMTQELMQLFVKYQIPSDLLSYDPDTAPAPEMEGDMEIVPDGPAPPRKPVDVVKAHMKAIQEVIGQTKGEEIQERTMQAQYRRPASPESEEDEEEERGTRSARSAGASKKKKKSAEKAAQPQQQPQQREEKQQQPGQAPRNLASGAARDYTQVPSDLEQRFEELDFGRSLRPTIIAPSQSWTKKSQKALLGKPTTSTVTPDEQKKEKEAAFDLLDALTKSGALPLDDASLHIVVAATHCFDKSVTETVVQDNCNPISVVEQSTLVMASMVHQLAPAALLREAELPRLTAAAPALF